MTDRFVQAPPHRFLHHRKNLATAVVVQNLQILVLKNENRIKNYVKINGYFAMCLKSTLNEIIPPARSLFDLLCKQQQQDSNRVAVL